jgi:hypothetical protein
LQRRSAAIAADRNTQIDFAEDTANPLLLAVAVSKSPRRTAAIASGIPGGERDQRLHALQEQLMEARYNEEASISYDDTRTASAPAWAILQVKVPARWRREAPVRFSSTAYPSAGSL